MTSKTSTSGVTPPAATQPTELEALTGFDPRGALEAAIDGARLADPVILGEHGQKHVILPDGYRLVEVADPHRTPPRPKQAVTVDDRASLSTYLNRYKTEASVIIADFDALTITGYIDWHPHNEHEDFGFGAMVQHKAALKLRSSEEFTRWNAMAGKLHPQETFARFLEENSMDVAFPEAAIMVEISRDFEATVGQSYKSSVRLDNGDRRLRFESDTRVQNDVVIPEKFTLSIPIYNGEAPDILTAMFRWRALDGGVALGFEWHRVEYQRRAHFAQIAALAADETGLPWIAGRAA